MELLLVRASGLGGYAIWGFLEGGLGHKHERSEEEGIARRVAYFGRGLLYAGTCVVTVLVISGSRAGRGGKEEDRATAVILDLPFGSWIVAGVGLGFLGAAAVNAYRAVTGKFRDELKTEQLSASEERWVTTVGSIGHGARVVVFAIVGVFLIRAAIEYDPKEAVGLDGALLKVAQEAYGTVLLGIVAAGLAAYGLFCFIQARYREV